MNNSNQVSAIVLAAGSSLRMNGPNKLLLTYKGKTFIESVVDNLLESKVKEIIVVVGFEKEKVRTVLQNREVIIVENLNHLNGMTSGIIAGVSVAEGIGYIICLSDMVKLLADDYNQLIHVFETNHRKNSKCIIVPQFKGNWGNPVIFSSHYKNDILNNSITEGCKNIVMKNNQQISLVDFLNDNIMIDVDSPEDYSKLEVK